METTMVTRTDAESVRAAPDPNGATNWDSPPPERPFLLRIAKGAKRTIDYFRATTAAYVTKRKIVSHKPLMLHIEMTNHCNLRCIMCFQSPNQNTMKRARGFISPETFKLTVDKAKGFFTAIQICNAGEPTMHPKLPELIRYAVDRGFDVELTSNGTLMDPQKARKILNTGVRSVDFSIDGISKETYEKIRVGATFEKTIANVRDFLKLKRERANKRPFVTLGIATQKDNLHEIPRYKDFFRGQGIDVNHFYFTPAQDWAGAVESEYVQSHPTFHKKHYICLIPWLMLGVTWDGVIIPCCIDPEAEYILGHVTKHDFREVWNGPRMQFMREAMIHGRPEDMARITPCDVCSRTNYRPPRGGYTFERIRYEVAKILF